MLKFNHTSWLKETLSRVIAHVVGSLLSIPFEWVVSKAITGLTIPLLLAIGAHLGIHPPAS